MPLPGCYRQVLNGAELQRFLVVFIPVRSSGQAELITLSRKSAPPQQGISITLDMNRRDIKIYIITIIK